MAEEIVRIIKVDTKNSGKSIKDLRNEIKALRTELEKTEVGSEEFSAALKKLTQTQKEYNSVQQQVRDMSKTNQQSMVQFASFARNLGKAYSSLNAAIGLFADKNEDVQRAMLRVQRTIQLVQGLDGIAGLVRDIPKILAGFKNWFTALDPVERQVNNIVKGINGVDPAKVRSITEANRLAAEAAKAPTTTATVAGGVQQQYLPAQTEELKAQAKTYYPALLEQERSLLQQRKQALSNLTEQKAKLEANQKILKETERLYNDVSSTMQLINASDLTDTEKITTFNDRMKELGHTLQIDEFNMQAFTNQYAELSTEVKNNGVAFNENKATLAEIDKQLAATRKGIIEAEAGMTGFQKALAKTGVVGKTAFTMIKTALASIGIGLLISALTAAGAALVKYIKNLNEAAREQKQLNKEINQTTNQIASKQIVVLKELSIAYGKVGDSAKAKEQFLEDYKDKIKETGIAINDVKTAEDVLVNNTDKYVTALMKRAEAQAAEQVAIKIYQDYLNERYDLEQKLIENNERLSNIKPNYAAPMGSGMNTSRDLEVLLQTSEDIGNQIAELEEKTNKRLESLLSLSVRYDKEAAGILGSLTSGGGKDGGAKIDYAKEYQESLEAIRKFSQDYLDFMKDERTKELDANKRAFDEEVKNLTEYYKKGIEAARGDADKQEALRKERFEAMKKLRLKYQSQELDIIDKHNDDVFKKKIAEYDRDYALLEKQLERIRKLNDTDNLKEPEKASYQTYKTTKFLGLGGVGSWTSAFQSKEQAKKERDDQIKYNNEFYATTKERLTQENNLLTKENDTLTKKAEELKKQLENVNQLDLDKQKELKAQLLDVENTKLTNQQTINKNMAALRKADTDNAQANAEAQNEYQEKMMAKLQARLEIASQVSGALAQIAKTEAQNAEEGSKKQKAAMIAYKTFAITQAIADTWRGANEAFVSMASIPTVGPALGMAAAAAAVAMGLANVHSIINEKMSGSVQQSSVSAPAAMQAPPIEYTRNLVGDKELDEINQPIRCYVLESDISKTQNKVKVTEQNATF